MRNRTAVWRPCLLVVILAGAAGSLLAQGNPSTIAPYSPQPTLISGEQVQLAATARDNSGNALTLSNFTWTSNHPEFVSVDARGLATATGLGVADITAAIGNVRGVVRLQSIPSRITISPARVDLNIGEQQRFTATALDVNGNPISGVTFVWAANGDNGGLSVVGSIDQTGLFTAAGAANFTVRAIVYYPNYPGDFATQIFGTAEVHILPIHDYRLTRLISTQDIRGGLRLRPRRNSIVANDAGQVAMTASLDGLTSALVQYDGTRVNLLMSGGVAGVVQNGVVWDFPDPVMNASGTVLARVDEVGGGSSLALLKDGTTSTVQIDGEVIRVDQVQSSNNTFSRYSLNDNDDFIYRANWRADATSPTFTGLYRYSNGILNSDRVPTDPLPGIDAPVSFGSEMGIDNRGNVWFTASNGPVTGVFREDAGRNAVKVLATGDTLAGATVTSIFQLGVQAASGDAIVTGNSNKGQFLARYAGANPQGPPVVSISGNFFSLFSFNNGGPVLSGYGAQGNGLYTFRSDAPAKLVTVGAITASGEPIISFQSAALLRNGDLVAYISTPSQPMAIVRLGAGNSATGATLFSMGTRVDSMVNLALRDIVPGAKEGPPHITMGGGNASLFSAETSGPSPALVVGDSLPGGWPFLGTYSARKSPNGDLYITIDQALYRIAAGKPSILARFNFPCETNVTCFAPSIVSVNDNGTVAAIMNSSATQRMAILDGGALKVILRVGDSIPVAGRVNNFNGNEFALDSSGRVMAFLNGASASEYFVYSGGSWAPVAVLNSTDLGGLVTSVSGLKSAGGKFYSLLSLNNGGFFVGVWDGQWTPLITRNAPSPNGNTISGINSFDVNRNGDLAVAANVNGTLSIMIQSADRIRMVHFGSEPLEPNWWLRTYNSLDLRDDRRLYFTAWSIDDQYALYSAEPLN